MVQEIIELLEALPGCKGGYFDSTDKAPVVGGPEAGSVPCRTDTRDRARGSEYAQDSCLELSMHTSVRKFQHAALESPHCITTLRHNGKGRVEESEMVKLHGKGLQS
jgi:hypothetical protein